MRAASPAAQQKASTCSVNRRARPRSPAPRRRCGPAQEAVALPQRLVPLPSPRAPRRVDASSQLSATRSTRRSSAGSATFSSAASCSSSLSISSVNALAPARRRSRMSWRPVRVIATRTTLASARSRRRSARPNCSSWVTNEVIDGCVISSVTARSVNRFGPAFSSVASVDNAVRLSVRDRRRMIPAARVYSASPRASFPCATTKAYAYLYSYANVNLRRRLTGVDLLAGQADVCTGEHGNVDTGGVDDFLGALPGIVGDGTEVAAHAAGRRCARFRRFGSAHTGWTRCHAGSWYGRRLFPGRSHASPDE